MIKVTTMAGDVMFLNSDLIESITETPDTLITLSNGNHYLVLEPARVLVGRIVNFKARTFKHAGPDAGKRYLRRNDMERYRPCCDL
jgi:flagellar protein FlbD